MSSDLYQSTWICLCFPSDIRNIGGAIRAVANFKLAGLKVILEPQVILPEEKLNAFSSGAYQHIKFERYQNLVQATKEADLLVGTSRRPRSHKHLTNYQSSDLTNIISSCQQTHILFGNERVGLSRKELDLCHALVEIHSDAGFPSLNLAHAVVCLAYELTRPNVQAKQPSRTDEKLQAFGISSEEVKPQFTPAHTSSTEDEAFLRRVIEVCKRTGFPPGKNAETYGRKLRSLLRRAQPKSGDYGMILGLFRELDRLKYLSRDQAHLAKNIPQDDK